MKKWEIDAWNEVIKIQNELLGFSPAQKTMERNSFFRELLEFVINTCTKEEKEQFKKFMLDEGGLQSEIEIVSEKFPSLINRFNKFKNFK